MNAQSLQVYDGVPQLDSHDVDGDTVLAVIPDRDHRTGQPENRAVLFQVVCRLHV